VSWLSIITYIDFMFCRYLVVVKANKILTAVLPRRTVRPKQTATYKGLRMQYLQPDAKIVPRQHVSNNRAK
jgi:hypothetical protein